MRVEPTVRDAIAVGKLEQPQRLRIFFPSYYGQRRNSTQHEDLASGRKGCDKNIAQVWDGGDDLVHTRMRHDQHLARLTNDACGKSALAGKEPKLAIEFARPTRLEDVIGIRAIDDVGCSFEHDNEAIGALSDVK